MQTMYKGIWKIRIPQLVHSNFRNKILLIKWNECGAQSKAL
jgi:hypothetical protein